MSLIWKQVQPSRIYDKRYELVQDRRVVATLYFTYVLDLWHWNREGNSSWPDWRSLDQEEARQALADPETWWMSQLL